MSEKPNRRYWELHLSTLVVLSLAVGGLMWLNLPRLIEFPSLSEFTQFECQVFWSDSVQGWPAAFRLSPSAKRGITPESIRLFSKPMLCFDCFVWLAILAAVAFICEYRVRQNLDPNTYKRSLWRLHLSTVILLSLAAGWLLLSNMPYEIESDIVEGKSDVFQGWPRVFRAISASSRGYNYFSWWMLCVDCIVCVVILSVITYVSELLTRRNAKP